eukprot:1047860-Rhodomonas_salina.3
MQPSRSHPCPPPAQRPPHVDASSKHQTSMWSRREGRVWGGRGVGCGVGPAVEELDLDLAFADDEGGVGLLAFQ